MVLGNRLGVILLWRKNIYLMHCLGGKRVTEECISPRVLLRYLIFCSRSDEEQRRTSAIVVHVECIGPRRLLSDLIISSRTDKNIRHSCWPCPIGDEEIKLKYSTGICRVRLEFGFLLIGTD